MSNPTIVILSSLHWHSTWQRHQDIASGLAGGGHCVIYVEPVPKRWPGPGEWRRVAGRLRGSAGDAGYCAQEVPEGVTLVSPRLLPDVGAVAQWSNRQFFVGGIAEQIRALSGPGPLVVINYLPLPASLALQQALEPDLAIYDCVADWSSFPLTGNLSAVEDQLLAHSDVVFADSPFLFEKMGRRHACVRQVLPAVHYERFAAAQAQDGVPSGEQSLCVYFGTLGHALDMALLQKVSESYALRLIGPARAPLPNFSPQVELCGMMAHDEVPRHLQDADVLLLPYDSEAPHLKAVIPAKTFECLATGIPTVVAGLTSLGDYAELFYLADSHETFLAGIVAALNEDRARRAPRIDCARANSWAARIAEIEAIITAGLAGELEGTAAAQQIEET